MLSVDPVSGETMEKVNKEAIKAQLYQAVLKTVRSDLSKPAA